MIQERHDRYAPQKGKEHEKISVCLSDSNLLLLVRPLIKGRLKRYKHPETAKMLIDAGAHVNEQEINGWTALMFAVMHGDMESVENLIEADADVNLKTLNGETPLKGAKLLENEKVVEILLAAGAQ